MAPTGKAKVERFSLNPGYPTAESVAKLFKALTGKTTSPEKLVQMQAILDSDDPSLAAKA